MQQEGMKMIDKLRVLRVVNSQLQHLQEKPNFKVSCAIIPELKISYDEGEFIASFLHAYEIQFNGPTWLNVDSVENQISLSFPDSFLLEYVSFIYECYNNRKATPSSSLSDCVLMALKTLRLRWIPGSEPLSETMQQRLLGELAVIRHGVKILGSNIIDSWDSDGRALHDFESLDYIIEAKATTTSPEKVEITSLEQLQDRSKPMFLAVSSVSKVSIGGFYFHEIVEDWLLDIKKLNINDFLNLQILLNSIGYNLANSTPYRTKWLVNGIRLIPIDENTPIFPLEVTDLIPKQVEIGGYRLQTENLESINFESLSQYIQ